MKKQKLNSGVVEKTVIQQHSTEQQYMEVTQDGQSQHRQQRMQQQQFVQQQQQYGYQNQELSQQQQQIQFTQQQNQPLVPIQQQQQQRQMQTMQTQQRQIQQREQVVQQQTQQQRVGQTQVHHTPLQTITNLPRTGGSPPIFTQIFRNTRFASGSTATFEGCVTGSPKPTVEWVRNGKTLLPSNKYAMNYHPQSGRIQLHINTINAQDQGEYTCCARNDYGDAVCTVFIQPEQLPQQRTQLGQLNQQQRWSQQKSDSRTEEFTVETFEHRLLNETSYRQVHTEQREIQAPRTVNYGIPQSPPVLIQPLRNTKLLEGSTAAFTARYTANPDASVTWFHNGRRLVPSNRVAISTKSNESTLALRTIMPEDSGHFTILLENPLGCIVQSAQLFVDKLEEEVKTSPPQFLKKPANLQIQEGKTARIECKVIGKPYPELTWFINGSQVVNDVNHKTLVNESGNHSLLIYNIKKHEEGVVTCIARNVQGEDRCQMNLEVIQAEVLVSPKFMQRFKSTTIRAGNKLELGVRVMGVPDVRIQWQKDNYPITQDHHININTTQDMSTLFIPSCTANDSGWYTVIATNTAGTTSTRARVTVVEEQEAPTPAWRLQLPKPVKTIEPEAPQDPEVIYLRHIEPIKQTYKRQLSNEPVYEPPIFLIPLKDLTVTEGSRAHLDAKVYPVGDSTMKINWYWNDRLVESSSRINTINNFGFVALDIINTNLSDSGVFRCVVKSATGTAESSAVLQVEPRQDSYSQLTTSTLSKLQYLEDSSRYMRQTTVMEEPTVPPRFTKEIKSLSLPESSSAHFEGRIEPLGENVQLEWYKDGRPLVSSSRINTINNFGYVSLNINQLRAEDAGVYTCRIWNAAGQAESVAQLNVIVQQQPAEQHFEYTRQVSKYVEEEVVEATTAPIFKTPLRDQLDLQELGFAHFEARLEPLNDPSLFIEWHKDGTPIEASSRINSFFNFGYVALTIKELRQSDMGTYTCVAKNKLGQAQTSASLTLKKLEKVTKSMERTVISKASYNFAPEFVQQLKYTTKLFEGQRAHFETQFNHTQASVTWYKDNKPLQLSNRIQTNVDYGYISLDISNVTREDSGIYTVVVSNELGHKQQTAELVVEKKTQQVTSVAKITREEPTIKPAFLKQLSNVTAKEQTTVHLETHLNQCPDASIEWYKDGKPLTIGSRFKTYYDFGYVSLDINHVTSNDTGEYTVVAKNAAGQAVTSCIVQVQPSQQIETQTLNEAALEQMDYLEHRTKRQDLEAPTEFPPPSFTKQLKPVQTTELSNVHLEARLQPVGDPSMRVFWFKDNQPVPVGSRFHPSHEFDYVSLDILGVYTTDSGIYTCAAKSNSGEVFTQCAVHVTSSMDAELGGAYSSKGMQQLQYLEDTSKYSRSAQIEESLSTVPRFITKPKNSGVREYETSHFECKLEPLNDPNLTVQWYKDGKPLTIGSRFVHIHDFGYVALDIKNVIPEDTGVYTCRATNLVGTDQVECELICKRTKSIVSDRQVEVAHLEKEPKPIQQEPDYVSTQAPVFTTAIKNIQLQEGQRGHFECRLIPVSDPTMVVTWYKDGQELKSGSRFNTVESFGYVALDIHNSIVDDQGEYTVVARNSQGQAINSGKLDVFGTGNIETASLNESSLSQIQLLENRRRSTKKQVESVTIAPQFTKPLSDVVKYENQPVHLEARLIPVGDSDLKVSWFRNGVPIEASNRISTIHDFGYVSLNMVYLKEIDSGTYSCLARNAHGEAVTSCKLIIRKEEEMHDYDLEKLRMLEDTSRYQRKEEEEITVRGPPRFVTPLAGPTSLPESSTGHVEARVEPYPDNTMKINWFKDGKPVLVGSRIKPTYDFGFVSLDIQDLIAEDSGLYTCKAENKFGQAQSQIQINVHSKSAIETESQHLDSLDKIKSLESPHKKQKMEEQAIREKPRFMKPLNNVNISEGMPVHLESTLLPLGDPTMEVTWYKDAVPLPTGHRFKTLYNFGFVAMDLLYAYPEDSGVYTCKAKNAVGEAQITCAVNIGPKSSLQLETMDALRLSKIQALETQPLQKPQEMAPAPMGPVFRTALQNITQPEASHVHLETNLVPINDPNLKICWFHNGQPLKTGHRFKTTHDFGYVALDILYAYPEDSGTYICKAENKVGSAVNTCEVKITTEDIVHSQHPDSLPKIQQLEAAKPKIARPEDEAVPAPVITAKLMGTEIVPEGGSAHFECKVNTPNCTVEWFKDGKPLQSSARHHLTNDFGYISLNISKCVRDDAGQYSVLARNKSGQATDSIQLQVITEKSVITESTRMEVLGKLKALDDKPKAPRGEVPVTYQRPIFTVPIANAQAPEGQNVHFEGRLIPVGDPKLKLQWFRNEKPLEDSSRIKKTHDFGFVALDIQHVRPTDEGVYMCRAVNDHGEAITTARMDLISSTPAVSTTSHHPESIPKIQQLEAKPAGRPQEAPVTYPKPIITAALTGPPEVWEGQPAHFECRVIPINDPNLTYEWYLNGVELQQGSRFRTTTDFGFISLDIQSTVLNDTGIYMCKVRNLAGEAITSTTMRVKPRDSIDSASLHPEALPKIQTIEAPAPRRPADMPQVFQPPIFTRNLTSYDNLPENTHLHLEAFLEPKGDPNLGVTWFKNGVPLESGSRFKPNFDFGLVTLDISGLRETDAGIYTCKGRNLVGEATTSCSIKVTPSAKLQLQPLNPEAVKLIGKLEEPAVKAAVQEAQPFPAPILSHLNDQDIMEGTNAHFECTVEPKNDPNLTVTWFKNGKPLETGSRFITKYDFGYISLDIQKCYKSDEGIYQVRATNRTGTATTTGTLKVRQLNETPRGTLHPKGAEGLEQILAAEQMLDAKQDRRPSLPAVTFQKPYWAPGLKPEFRLQENNFMQLQAQVEPRADPKLQIEWFQNGQPLVLGTRHKLLFDFGFVSLDVEDAQGRDSGNYTCRAWNDHGEALTSTVVYVDEKESNVFATTHPKGEEGLKKIQQIDQPKEAKPKQVAPFKGVPPKFTTPFKNLDLDEGDLGHSEACLVPVGDPDMVVTWFKDDDVIQAGARIRTVCSFGMCVIEVEDLKLLDAGTYTCHAKNNYGEDSASFTIAVKEYSRGRPPKFTKQLIPLDNMRDHDSAHFEATLVPVGDPDLTVEWLKDGEPLPLSSRIKTVYDFGFVSLDLADINEFDTGEYECRAKNKFGSDRVRAFLRCIGGHRGVDYGTLQPDAYARILELEGFGKEKRDMTTPYKLQPPIFIEHFQPLVLTEGQSAHFEAKLIPIGDPALKVTWYRDGIELKSGHKYRIFHDFGVVILDVLYCYEEDSGVYECRAVNDLGSDLTKATLQCSSKPSLILDPQIPVSMMGGLDKIRTLEEPKLKHQKQTVANTRAPVFTAPLTNVEAAEGESIHLEARIMPIDDPKLKIQWYKNGMPLRESSRFKYFNDFGFIVFEITSLTENDIGEYTVRAFNDFGDAVTSCKVICQSKTGMDTRSHLKTTGLEKIANLEGLGGPGEDEQESQEDAAGSPPTLTSIQPLELPENATARFECKLSPVTAKTTVDWFHNGKPLTTGSRIRTISEFGKVILEVNKILSRDSGIYTCKATNPHGTTTTDAKLQVISKKSLILEPQVPNSAIAVQNLEDSLNKQVSAVEEEQVQKAPLFVKELADVTVAEGESFQLTTRVEPINDSSQRVEWYYNGKPIIASSRVHTTNDFGFVSLDLDYAYLRDSGEYLCRVINKWGFSTTRCKVTIKSKTEKSNVSSKVIEKFNQLERGMVRNVAEEVAEDAAPKFTRHITPASLTEGDRLHFDTQVEPKRDPNLVVEWYLNGKPLVAGSRFHSMNEFGHITLDINSIKPEDTGVYECRARNLVGEDITRAQVTVKRSPSIVLQNQLPKGMKRNEALLQMEGTIKKYTSDVVLTEEDLFDVEKQQPPRFVTQIQSYESLKEKDSVKMDCQLSPVGDPNMKVEWFKDGKLLTHKNRLTPIYDFGYIALNFNWIYPEDAGVYVCRATNKYGSDTTTATITTITNPNIIYDSQLPASVQDHTISRIHEIEAPKPVRHLPEEIKERSAPIFVSQPEPVEVFEGDWAKFVCRITGVPRPRVLWIVNGKTVLNGTRYKLTYDGMYHLDIPKTRLYDAGEVRVIAKNILGETSAATTLAVVNRHDFRGALTKSSREAWDKSNQEESLSTLEKTLRDGNLLRPTEQTRAKAEVKDTEWQKVLKNKQFDDEYYQRLKELEATSHLSKDQQRLKEAITAKLNPTEIGRPKVEEDHAKRMIEEAARNINKREVSDVFIKSGIEQLTEKERESDMKIEKEKSALKAQGSRPPPEIQSKEAKTYDKSSVTEVSKQTQKEKQGDLLLTRNIKSTETLESESKGSTIEKVVKGVAGQPAGPKGTPPMFTKKLQPIYTTEKSSIQFEAEFTGTAPTISWFREDYEIHNSNDFKILTTGNKSVLVVKEVFLEDSGTFSCVATNAFGKAKSTTNLIVDKPKESGPPNFTKTLKDVRALQGSNVNFEVELTSKEPIQIQWTKNGEPIKPSQRHRITLFKNKATLSIQNAQENDSGSIQVIGTNSKGETSCSAELTVDAKPEVKKSAPKAPATSAPVVTVPLPVSTECLDGKSILLKCGFDGQPEPSVSWKKDGKPLKSTKLLQIYKSESHHYLKISKAFPEDEGIYEASGQNDQGTVTTQCKLLVKTTAIAQPPTLTPLKDITVDEGEPAEFKSSITGFPFTKVQWLREGVVIPEAEDFVMTTTPNSASLNIKETYEEDSGKFTLRLTNANGQVESSAKLVVESKD